MRNETRFIGPWRETTLMYNGQVGPPSSREPTFDISDLAAMEVSLEAEIRSVGGVTRSAAVSEDVTGEVREACDLLDFVEVS